MKLIKWLGGKMMDDGMKGIPGDTLIWNEGAMVAGHGRNDEV